MTRTIGARRVTDSERRQKLDSASITEGEQSRIERDQSQIVASSQGHEMRIGHLPVPVQRRHICVGNRHIVDQEPMSGERAQGRQHAARGFDPNRARQHLRIRRDTNEAAFRERAGRQAGLAVGYEPLPHPRMVDVRVPRQRDERVHVEQPH
jgi:hypothetical protein